MGAGRDAVRGRHGTAARRRQDIRRHAGRPGPARSRARGPAPRRSRCPPDRGHFIPASDYSDYRRLRIGPVAYYAQAAETEFTLHKRSIAADLHGLARVFTVTSGGQEYYVQLTALSATWQRSQPVFGVFFATFRPG